MTQNHNDTEPDASRHGTVFYSNAFEERGEIEGVIETCEVMGWEMVSVTRKSGAGAESLLHFNDVERIDYHSDGGDYRDTLKEAIEDEW